MWEFANINLIRLFSKTGFPYKLSLLLTISFVFWESLFVSSFLWIINTQYLTKQKWFILVMFRNWSKSWSWKQVMWTRVTEVMWTRVTEVMWTRVTEVMLTWVTEVMWTRVTEVMWTWMTEVMWTRMTEVIITPHTGPHVQTPSICWSKEVKLILSSIIYSSFTLTCATIKHDLITCYVIF